jgi:hypothetical protein
VPELQEAPGKKRFSQLMRQRTEGVPQDRHYSEETVKAFLEPVPIIVDIEKKEEVIDSPPEKAVTTTEPPAAPVALASLDLKEYMENIRNAAFEKFVKRKRQNNSRKFPTSLNLPWETEALILEVAEEYRQSKNTAIENLLFFALEQLGYVGKKREEILKPYREYFKAIEEKEKKNG